jgi:hypothetical protein
MTRIALTILWMAGALFAQSGAAPSGHWQGAIQTPDGDLNVEIDLAKMSDGGWIGTISIPAQNTKGLRLTDVSVKESAVSFAIKAPGDPRFQGTVAKEGGKMTGEMMQSGFNMPFQLTRTGEPKIEKPAQNPPLTKELEGTWEGTLNAGGQTLRLRFVLSNQAGKATGTLISLDQGNAEIPIEGISQTGAAVKITVPVVNGGFAGNLKGTEIAGTWSQNGNDLPLTLTKAAK